MPGRGLLVVASLVFIALCCISIVRKFERERRLLRKLRGRGAFDVGTSVPLRDLTEDERDCVESLATAGILTIRQNGCYLRVGELPVFRRKRLRLAVSGGFIALVLALVVAVLILHR
ncbi:MAG: hypothetical protein JO042_02945 [Sinobacteraceae bacterium]|nr:hypothetical protein [Nevskiaceae bacterium]